MKANICIGLCGLVFLGSPVAFCAAAADTKDERQRLTAEVDAAAAVNYLLSHERTNGAFGPAGHAHTDLAWNYPAVHALRLLQQPIPRPEECFRNGRGALYKQPGTHNPNSAWDIYQRAQLAVVMDRRGDDGLGLRNAWTVRYQDRKAEFYFQISAAMLKERVAPFCDLPTLAYWAEAITVAGGRIANPGIVREFLLARQLPGGAFVDAYDVTNVVAGDAHVVATAQAVFALRAVGGEVPRAPAVIAWIQSCQQPSGGFGWHPTSAAPSNQPDVWYTWAAVRALAQFGAKPANPDACLDWLNSLQNPDGGFADRPGWNSRLYSTYYAVHALQALTGDARGAIRLKQASVWRRVVPEGRYAIFHAYLKTPPGGPEMVEAARRLRLHFLGIKDNSPGTQPVSLSVARSYASEKGYPLEIISCPEQYGHKLTWRGGHPANHVANYLIPPELAPEAQAVLAAADRNGRKGLPWGEYGAQVIVPIVGLGSLFYPEHEYEMKNAYLVYDDGLAGGPGYNAVIGALGHPVWDWVRFFPYRERWQGQLPMVADADAHGDIEKWREPMERQRMLYLAMRHDLAGFLDACRQGRTVCVIRGGPDKAELAFYGDPAVVEYVKQRPQEWQWWK
jgi:prenyltransferase beta subunit